MTWKERQTAAVIAFLVLGMAVEALLLVMLQCRINRCRSVERSYNMLPCAVRGCK